MSGEAAGSTCSVSALPPVQESRRAYAPSSAWLTRVILLRWLGGVYVVAFWVAFTQGPALIGDDGLTPACKFLDSRPLPTDASLLDKLLAYPTLLWITGCSTSMLQAIAWCGFLLALVPVILGAANVPLMFALWVLYHSLNTVGQNWYSFGWETQLLETGFLAIFLVPMFSLDPFRRESPPSPVVIWAYRWLIFRIMLGAGLIKIRGDQCWRNVFNGSCMEFHYETQPVPNPVSYWFHLLPVWFQSLSTLTNHFVELPAPFLLLMGRPARVAGGVIQIGFQTILIVSGNLSFLNHLTITPALACLDDRFLESLFPASTLAKVPITHPPMAACVGDNGEHPVSSPLPTVHSPLKPDDSVQAEAEFSDATPSEQPSRTVRQRRRRSSDQAEDANQGAGRQQNPSDSESTLRAAPFPAEPRLHGPRANAGHASAGSAVGRTVRHVTNFGLAVALAYLSVPVVLNLVSQHQAMNRSFSPLAIVNTYGAFGSVGRVRPELVIQATNSSNPQSSEAVWYDYEFPCKPGNTDRRPCVISPYHYRMDWLMWFAAMGSYSHHPWLVLLVDRLVQGDESAFQFFVENPFPDPGSPPKYVRIRKYEYRFTPHGISDGSSVEALPLRQWNWSSDDDSVEIGRWWTRRLIDSGYIPPIEKDNPSVRQFLVAHGLGGKV